MKVQNLFTTAALALIASATALAADETKIIRCEGPGGIDPIVVRIKENGKADIFTSPVPGARGGWHLTYTDRPTETRDSSTLPVWPPQVSKTLAIALLNGSQDLEIDWKDPFFAKKCNVLYKTTGLSIRLNDKGEVSGTGSFVDSYGVASNPNAGTSESCLNGRVAPTRESRLACRVITEFKEGAEIKN